MAAAMAAGQADLAIGPVPDEWEGPVRPVGTEEFVVVTHPDDPVARNQAGRVALSDLAARRWVHFTAESGLAGFLDRACAAAGFQPRIAVRTEQGMSAANYAAAGLGPTLVPAEIIPPHFAGLLLTPDPPVRRPLTAYTRIDPDPIAAAFIDILADEALITPAHIRRRLGLSPR
jgi:DNA-binding transcriptional LysR family regulator